MNLLDKIQQRQSRYYEKEQLEDDLKKAKENFKITQFELSEKKKNDFIEAIKPRLEECFSNINMLKSDAIQPNFFDKYLNLGLSKDEENVNPIIKFLKEKARIMTEAFHNEGKHINLGIALLDEMKIVMTEYDDHKNELENTFTIPFKIENEKILPTDYKSTLIMSTGSLKEAKELFNYFVDYLDKEMEEFLIKETKSIDNDINHMQNEFSKIDNDISAIKDTDDYER